MPKEPEVYGWTGEVGYLVEFKQWSKAADPQQYMNDQCAFWRKEGYRVTVREYDDRYTMSVYEPVEFPTYVGWDGREHGEY